MNAAYSMNTMNTLNEMDRQPRQSRDWITFGKGKSGALSFVLIRLSDSYGVKSGGNNDRYIMKKLTSEELGSMIGASGECVDRMMNDLKRSEVLAYESGFIVVKKLSYLRSLHRRSDAFERFEYGESSRM
jgi:CRP-like cAMP-binding protein